MTLIPLAGNVFELMTKTHRIARQQGDSCSNVGDFETDVGKNVGTVRVFVSMVLTDLRSSRMAVILSEDLKSSRTDVVSSIN